MLNEAQVPEAGAPTRLTEAANSSILAQVAEAGLLERGCVTIIGLDAVRDRLADHWSAKRESVWDTAERVLTRKLRSGALWARISDVDFVISTGDESGMCRSVALSVLREILEFYLGAQRFEDMKISVVTAFKNGELACEALDPRTIAESFPATSRGSTQFSGAGSQFVTLTGSEITLQFGREQIVNLRNNTPIATRVVVQLQDRATAQPIKGRWPELLSLSSLAAVNSAIIDHVKNLYDQSSLGVMATCSIHALASAHNRTALVRLLEAVKRKPTKPILFELVDIDRGTPQGRVLEVVSAITPHCRKVVARVPFYKPPFDLLRGCRLSGLSVDCALHQDDTRSFMVEFLEFSERAKTVAPLVFALGLKSRTAGELAAAAGATHGGYAQNPEPAHLPDMSLEEAPIGPQNIVG